MTHSLLSKDIRNVVISIEYSNKQAALVIHKKKKLAIL